MIALKRLHVSGKTAKEKFSGEIDFQSGFQLFSAKNSYGKSSIFSGVMWALGLEPLYVSRPNDPVMLPDALRSTIELVEGKGEAIAECVIELQITNRAGDQMTIRRDTNPERAEFPEVSILKKDGNPETSKLKTGWGSRADQTAGFQSKLIEFIGLTSHDLMTVRASRSPIYLENLAPLFVIDQLEGWSNIQAQQILRYGLMEIHPAAVESLLGLDDRLHRRLLLQTAEHEQSTLKSELKAIYERFNKIIISSGSDKLMSVPQKKIHDLIAVVESRPVEKYLADTVNWNYVSERAAIVKSISSFRDLLSNPPTVDEGSRAHVAEVSAQVIDLQKKIHEKREELTRLVSQMRNQETLIHTIEHRETSVVDLLKLKRDGIGFPKELSCPTCQNTIQPENFNLINQDIATIELYLESVKRDRNLLRQSVRNTGIEISRAEAWLSEAEQSLRAKESTLHSITSTASEQRQALVKIASDITMAERRLEKLDVLNTEIGEIKTQISQWVERAKKFSAIESEGLGAPSPVIAKFEELFRDHLFRLKHSALDQKAPDKRVRLDEDYDPMFEERRLRSMGSASDQARLILAYTSALMLATIGEDGTQSHPGMLIYDEPYQQKPDEYHVANLTDFFKYLSEKTAKAQVIVFTTLSAEEQKPIKASGIKVVDLVGRKFLQKIETPKKES